jgi:aquaporin Z
MIKKFCAEFIGTFMLVLLACGTATVLGCSNKPDGAYILTALAFGLVIVAMAYSIGNVSGCHINPAVSLGVLINGGMTIDQAFSTAYNRACDAAK